MRIAIFGAGGVGGYFGARLAASGEDVTFIARGPHLAAIRERGLQVRSLKGDVTIHPAEATDDPVAIGPVDLVIIAVKLYDTDAVAAALPALVGPSTAVVSFQNGVTATDTLAEVAGAERVFGGSSYIMATIAEPGVIAHLGSNARLVFGELDGRASDRTERLLSACRTAGIDADVSSDIRAELWTKVTMLTALSGATSVTRLPIGPLREDPRTRALLRAALNEAIAVADAAGVVLPLDLADRQMAYFDGLDARTGSSMLYDLAHGKRLELPWLAGALVRLGRESDTPTPTHAFIEAALTLHAGGSTA